MSSQVKLNRNVTIGLIIGAVLIVLGIIFLRPTEHDKIRKAYDGLDDSHIFDSVSYSEFQKLGDKESGIYLAVISRPTCPACQKQMQYIDKAVKSRIEDGTIDVDVIYYLNTDEMSEKDKNSLVSTYGVSGSTPDLLIMNDNNLVKSSVNWNDEVEGGNWSYDSSGDVDYYRTYRNFIKKFAV